MNLNANWLIQNWKLKLVAIGLAMGLLVAVAFSENPVTVKTVQAKVNYTGLPHELALSQYPTRVPVTVIGLADAVKEPRVVVVVDLSHVHKGVGVTVDGSPQVLDPGVSSQTDRVAISLNVDDLALKKELDIEVRTPRVTSGWTIDKVAASPAKVSVDGPAGVLSDLKAFVQLDAPVENSVIDSPNQLVQFEQQGKKIDLRGLGTIPPLSIEPSTVLIHVEAHQPKQTRTAYLSANLTGSPAQGFAVKSVVVSPASIEISGPGDVINKISTLQLASVSIDGLKDGTQTLRAAVLLPDQVESTTRQAQVTVVVYALPSTAPPPPSPSPSPTR